MSTKRRWRAVIQNFTSNGTAGGIVTVGETCGFFNGQRVSVGSDTQPTITLFVKEVLSATQIHLQKKSGKVNKDLNIDLSNYLVSDNASIKASEQRMLDVTPEDVVQEVFERGPVNALRSVITDKRGNLISKDNPLHVELRSEINVGEVNIESPNTLEVINKSIAIKDTEVEVLLPDDAKKYEIFARRPFAELKLAFNSGETATKFMTIPMGSRWKSDDLDLSNGSKIFLSSSKDSIVVEILVWRLI